MTDSDYFKEALRQLLNLKEFCDPDWVKSYLKVYFPEIKLSCKPNGYIEKIERIKND